MTTPNPFHTSRPPKILNWEVIDKTPMSLAIAAIRQEELNGRQCAMRVLVALHEAAHFVADVMYTTKVRDVSIGPTKYRRNNDGGRLRDYGSGFNEYEGVVFFAGTFAETELLNGVDTPAGYNDYTNGCLSILSWPYEKRRDEINFELESQNRRAADVVNNYWALIDLTATVFLLYSNTRGEFKGEPVTALWDEVRQRFEKSIERGICFIPGRAHSAELTRRNLGVKVTQIWAEECPAAEKSFIDNERQKWRKEIARTFDG